MTKQIFQCGKTSSSNNAYYRRIQQLSFSLSTFPSFVFFEWELKKHLENQDELRDCFHIISSGHREGTAK